jgi:hypothetical protein
MSESLTWICSRNIHYCCSAILYLISRLPLYSADPSRAQANIAVQPPVIWTDHAHMKLQPLSLNFFSVNVLEDCICTVLCWTGCVLRCAVLHYKTESCIPMRFAAVTCNQVKKISNMQPLVLCFTLLNRELTALVSIQDMLFFFFFETRNMQPRYLTSSTISFICICLAWTASKHYSIEIS